jgi:hypothetical protein
MLVLDAIALSAAFIPLCYVSLWFAKPLIFREQNAFSVQMFHFLQLPQGCTMVSPSIWHVAISGTSGAHC